MIGAVGRIGYLGLSGGSRLLYPSYVQDYLDRVTAADVTAGNTQGLERGVTDGFNICLQGMVADGSLGVSSNVLAQAASTVKAGCLMAGARTLSGALTPIAADMPAPTNYNFVSGDYDRKTGLVGDGLSKYLNTNYKISQYTTGENLHLGLFGTSNLNSGRPMGVFRAGIYTRHYLPCDDYINGAGWGSPTAANILGSGHYIATRVTGQTPARYINGSFDVNLDTDNSTPSDHPVGVFCALGSATGASAETTETFGFSSARIAFYHIGDGLTASQVSALNGRRADLFTAFAAVIP
jgi:hypothetical protein